MPAEVRTNLDQKDVHDALLKTFEKWVKFSLGVGKLDGHMLRHPSGRMAAALKAETDPDGNVVAIYIDKDEIGSQDYNFIVHGHKAFSLKQRMLKWGLPGVRKNKKTGNLYRYVPISSDPVKPKQIFQSASYIKNLFTSKSTDQGGIIHLNRNLASMWLSNYKRAHRTYQKIRTMSYKPGSARWMIPAMPAFNVPRLLRQMLPKPLKDRVID